MSATFFIKRCSVSRMIGGDLGSFHRCLLVVETVRSAVAPWDMADLEPAAEGRFEEQSVLLNILSDGGLDVPISRYGCPSFG